MPCLRQRELVEPAGQELCLYAIRVHGGMMREIRFLQLVARVHGGQGGFGLAAALHRDRFGDGKGQSGGRGLSHLPRSARTRVAACCCCCSRASGRAVRVARVVARQRALAGEWSRAVDDGQAVFDEAGGGLFVRGDGAVGADLAGGDVVGAVAEDVVSEDVDDAHDKGEDAGGDDDAPKGHAERLLRRRRLVQEPEDPIAQPDHGQPESEEARRRREEGPGARDVGF